MLHTSLLILLLLIPSPLIPSPLIPLYLQLPALVGPGCLLGAPHPLDHLTLGEMGLLLTSLDQQQLTVWEAEEIDRLQVCIYSNTHICVGRCAALAGKAESGRTDSWVTVCWQCGGRRRLTGYR